MRGVKSWKSALLILVALLSATAFCYAATVPQIINYQGTLTNKDGTKANGSVNMTFSVYSSSSGSAPLWTETRSATSTSANPVILQEGNFNVMLGAFTPFPPTFFADYPKTYLGIKVGADAEVLPRQQLASVGYSFAAGNGVPKGGIIMWSGAVSKIPDGWALCDGTNGTPDLRDRFIVGAGNPLYPVNATGGAATINLQHSHLVNSHSHGFVADGAHSHTGTTGGPSGTSDAEKGSGTPKPESTHTHNFSTSVVGNHGHGFVAQAPDTNTQLSSAQDIRPPYYALAFIIKL